MSRETRIEHAPVPFVEKSAAIFLLLKLIMRPFIFLLWPDTIVKSVWKLTKLEVPLLFTWPINIGINKWLQAGCVDIMTSIIFQAAHFHFMTTSWRVRRASNYFTAWSARKKVMTRVIFVNTLRIFIFLAVLKTNASTAVRRSLQEILWTFMFQKCTEDWISKHLVDNKLSYNFDDFDE